MKPHPTPYRPASCNAATVATFSESDRLLAHADALDAASAALRGEAAKVLRHDSEARRWMRTLNSTREILGAVRGESCEAAARRVMAWKTPVIVNSDPCAVKVGDRFLRVASGFVYIVVERPSLVFELTCESVEGWWDLYGSLEDLAAEVANSAVWKRLPPIEALPATVNVETAPCAVKLEDRFERAGCKYVVRLDGRGDWMLANEATGGRWDRWSKLSEIEAYLAGNAEWKRLPPIESTPATPNVPSNIESLTHDLAVAKRTIEDLQCERDVALRQFAEARAEIAKRDAQVAPIRKGDRFKRLNGNCAGEITKVIADNPVHYSQAKMWPCDNGWENVSESFLLDPSKWRRLPREVQ